MVHTTSPTRPAMSASSPVGSDPTDAGAAGASTPPVAPATNSPRVGAVAYVVSRHAFRCPCHPGLHQLVAVRCPYCRDVHAARWTYGSPEVVKLCWRASWAPFVIVADPRRFPSLTLAAVA